MTLVAYKKVYTWEYTWLNIIPVNYIMVGHCQWGCSIKAGAKSNGDTVIPSSIFGDWAFPSKSYSLKSYDDAVPSDKKRYFDFWVSRGRMTIEGAFGKLKGRWHILSTKCEKMTVASLSFTWRMLSDVNYFCKIHDTFFHGLCTMQRLLIPAFCKSWGI